VVAVGKNDSGQCDVSDWRDIVAISAGEWHTVGLKADGTVVAAGVIGDGDFNDDPNVDLRYSCDLSDWYDVIEVSAGWFNTVGLKVDGTIVTKGGFVQYN
jgi:alpha-tubulin suppressor-like RCC1 family protein